MLFGGNVNWVGLVALIVALALVISAGFYREKHDRCVHWDWDNHLKPCPLHYDDGSAKPAIDDW